MPICRICGKQYRENYNSASEICSNQKCWDKAWNDAVAPLRRSSVPDYKKIFGGEVNE